MLSGENSNCVLYFQVPVYAGARDSLMVTPPSDFYFGNDGFGDFDYPNPPDPDQYLQKEFAVDALVRLVAEQPGEWFCC